MSVKLFDLSGRVALVTGSGQGLGLAIARGLAEAGATVALNGRDSAKLDRAVGAFGGAGLSAAAAPFDVTDEAAVEAGIAAIERDVGPIAILVNNAGIQLRGALEDYPRAHWDRIVATNLTSVFTVGQAVARRMIPRRQGKIVNIASLMAEVARPSIAPYAATKGAIKSLTKGMAIDWAKYGIQVNAIGPGYFKTELNTVLVNDADFSAWVEKRTPAGRWGEVEELAGAAIFLSSPASNFVTGQVIYVDGGFLTGV
jgi:gluconate 5-dehydrogenase